MGIDVHVLNFLLLHRREGVKFGRTATLGRQTLFINKSEDVQRANDFLREHSAPVLDDLRMPDGFAEKLLSWMGCTEIHAIDKSGFEGAAIQHDMNEPLPDELVFQFDAVLDGGTIEHVFNVPVAFSNVMRMLRPGGVFITINGANHHLGHGFYQFSPEIFYRCFCPENGFDDARAYIAAAEGDPECRFVADPQKVGRRVQMRTKRAAYLMGFARKSRNTTPFKAWPQQSDYSVAWRKE